MTQPFLPYRDTDCQPETASPALLELHALRDAYALRCRRALERHFTGKWTEYVESCCRFPLGRVEGLAVMAEHVSEMADWSAMTRFAWIAQRCWEAEMDEFCHRHFEQKAV